MKSHIITIWDVAGEKQLTNAKPTPLTPHILFAEPNSFICILTRIQSNLPTQHSTLKNVRL